MEIKKTKRRVLNKRGVVWLGQTCNQRCYFCYFINRIEDHHHPEHAFMSLDKAKRIMDTLRHFYGNNSVDIQGGEPTIYRDILPLVRHCRDIGLYPTLITNALLLAKTDAVSRYKDAGLRDFLVSLHGVDEIHDEVVGVPGAYRKITAGLEQIQTQQFPFRINCTMSKPAVETITKVAQKAIEYGALAVNYIAFNPFNDQQSGRRCADTVAKYTDIRPILTEAMDMLEKAGIEVNVRYLPLCFAEKRHRKNFYNYQQISYDLHEWDYQSWMWTMMVTQMMREGEVAPPFKLGPGARKLYVANARHLRDAYQQHPYRRGVKYWAQHRVAELTQLMQGKACLYRKEAKERAQQDCNYKYGKACESCHVRDICDGFHGDYVAFFGTEEATPITDVETSKDPCLFIQEQEKVVLPEDQSWAL